MNLFAELKRRRVFRVAGVYAIAAWAAIEVSDTILPRLGLPEWTVTLVIVIALIGFPVAVGLAWAFDITPDGVQRTPNAPADPSFRPAPPKRAIAYIAVGMLATLVLYGMYDYVRPDATPAPASASASVAVLPFVNMSDSKETEYFSDGITEDVLNALAQIEGLRVAARTSSFAFKGRNLPVSEIAQQLGVATILEGSVQRAGDRLRITAQLINAADGMHLWSQKFDREAKDIFAVEDEISRAIGEALRVELSRGGTTSAHARHTANPAAHDAYLLGLYHFHRRGIDGLRTSIRHFERAIAVDSTYALAWAGIAMAASTLPVYDYRASAVTLLRTAKAAANRALALDSTLAEAHAGYGSTILALDWDLAGTERAYVRALTLNPNFSTAHHWYSELLSAQARFEEARIQSDAARRLDPLSPIINFGGASIDYYEGNFDAALVKLAHVLELQPDFQPAHYLVSFTYLHQKRFEEAVAAFESWGAVSGGQNTEQVRGAILRISRGQDARPLLQTMRRALIEDIGFGGTAMLFMAADDRNTALDILEASVAAHDWFAVTVGVEPPFAPLRGDPRFTALLRSVNLDPSKLPR